MISFADDCREYITKIEKLAPFNWKWILCAKMLKEKMVLFFDSLWDKVSYWLRFGHTSPRCLKGYCFFWSPMIGGLFVFLEALLFCFISGFSFLLFSFVFGGCLFLALYLFPFFNEIFLLLIKKDGFILQNTRNWSVSFEFIPWLRLIIFFSYSSFSAIPITICFIYWLQSFFFFLYFVPFTFPSVQASTSTLISFFMPTHLSLGAVSTWCLGLARKCK